MERITASVPVTTPPSWAVQQRLLLQTMERSALPFWDRYVRDDGELYWDSFGGVSPDDYGYGGSSPDDFYEAFCSWPLVYLMGGGDHLLEMAHRGWEGITRQLTRSGTVHKEYARCEDQFHQSESDIFFYHLCMADPANASLAIRAQRFAGFYLNEDPEAINYDPEHRIILSPFNGSGGARQTPAGAPQSLRARENYGLPTYELPDIQSWTDTEDDDKAKRVGELMHGRWYRGDVPANLAISSLVTNAFLLTGEEKYRDWVVEYTDAWIERARANDGLIPDNVGLSGKVGEYIDGKWHGGLYGWTLYHGWYNLQMTVTVAAANAYLLTRDNRYLEFPRRQMDRILELGEIRDIRHEQMSLGHHFVGQFTAMGERTETLLVPYRYGDAGWFDWHPPSPVFLAALWNLSMADEDWQRIEQVREAETYDWNTVVSYRTKEDCMHEQPWLRFLAGANPDYPERMLQASYQQVAWRLALVRAETEVSTLRDVHRWQDTNPVSSEALIQLTLGAPPPVYNGGLLHCRLRYFDCGTRRSGLPGDVAALVEKLEADRTVVRLVNLNPQEDRELIVQAGGYGEHRFTDAEYDALTSPYPGPPNRYAPDPATAERRRVSVNGRHLEVALPAGTEMILELGTQRYVNEPASAGPF